jgi:hypothetical protein
MFFCGLHQPSDAKQISRAFISVNRLRTRRSDISAKGKWIMDSGAFTTIAKFGGYPSPISEYAAEIRRWSRSPGLLAAVAQDYMCEPHMLAKTGLTVIEHQRLTIERYDDLIAENVGVYVLPVLQGYAPDEYVSHVRQYGARLEPGMWVGVGSICKRNGNPSAIVAVLQAIKAERPDLRLHGFGLKKTSLQIATIVDFLHSADSMAWSYAARMNGRDGNCWREAERFASWIERMPQQTEFAV